MSNNRLWKPSQDAANQMMFKHDALMLADDEMGDISRSTRAVVNSVVLDITNIRANEALRLLIDKLGEQVDEDILAKLATEVRRERKLGCF